MKSAFNGWKVHIEFTPATVYQQIRTRYRQEYIHYKAKGGPWNTFGFKTSLLLGTIGSFWVGYREGRDIMRHEAKYEYTYLNRKDAIKWACLEGAFYGVVGGALWPALPFLLLPVPIYYMAEFTSRTSERKK